MIEKRVPENLIPLHSSPELRGLVALQAIPNDALKSIREGQSLPTRLKLFNWGANDTVSKGVFCVGDSTLADLARNQEALGFDTIALDFNHNSLPGHPNFKPDPREIAGYGKPLAIAGDGLYIDGIEWTPAGRKFAPNYHDLSPTPRLNAAGEVDFLHSVALCPQGEVKGLTFLSSDFLTPLSNPKSKIQNPKSKNAMIDCKKLLCAILGLDPEKATDEEITTAAEKFGKEEKKEPDHKEGSDGGDGGEGAEGAEKSTEALSAAIGKAIKPVTDQLTALQARMDGSDRENLIALAVRDGKEIPKSATEGAQALNNTQLKALIADLPVTVPLSRRTPEGVTALAAPNGGKGIDPVQSEINKRLGIDDATFKKHA